MSLPSWLETAFRFAPFILAQIPATAPIAGKVADAIIDVEKLSNVSGPEKKMIVMEIAEDAISSINTSAKKQLVPPAETLKATSRAIDTTISVINTFHAAHGQEIK